MYNVRKEVNANLGRFRMSRHFRYNNFVPKLYNWCLELGFESGKILPARAFCSDESQGFPIILLAKHFGVFPFNLGRVGGVMANALSGPYAHHGKDLVIVHSSHVGYDPKTSSYGMYLRSQTENNSCSTNCGKMHATLEWYLKEYEYARENILVDLRGDQCLITLDNKYLSMSHSNSLVLHLQDIVEHQTDGTLMPLSVQSTARTFKATKEFHRQIKWFFNENKGAQPIGDALLPEYFSYQKEMSDNIDANQLEYNLLGAMPWIVTSAEPMLTAAQANTQSEFDRAYRIISQDPNYKGRNLLYVSGLHVDISPEVGQPFLLTKFIPWAAYVQLKNGANYILEQDNLLTLLASFSDENPSQLDFDETIRRMEEATPISLKLPY